MHDIVVTPHEKRHWLLSWAYWRGNLSLSNNAESNDIEFPNVEHNVANMFYNSFKHNLSNYNQGLEWSILENLVCFNTVTENKCIWCSACFDVLLKTLCRFPLKPQTLSELHLLCKELWIQNRSLKKKGKKTDPKKLDPSTKLKFSQ